MSGPAASNFGQLVTFTATVTGAGATPTGTVQFKDGAVNIGTPRTLVAGSASIGIAALSVASHSITADYSGDGNYTASTSAVFTHVVSKADQAITFTSSAPAGAVVGGTTLHRRRHSHLRPYGGISNWSWPCGATTYCSGSWTNLGLPTAALKIRRSDALSDQKIVGIFLDRRARFVIVSLLSDI